MTTQAQGKGKKKGKEVTKVSLDEFNQIDAPHGHSVVSIKSTGLDWAETMADYDLQSSETQQIIVPVAPRAQRGPGVDFDSLPNEPPFRVSIFNLPMSIEEKELVERFFQNIDVVKVDLSSKTSTTVELGSKNDLYEALCKDGTSLKGRTVNVCMFGQTPQNAYNSDRYGGRSGNSYGDRYGDRNQGGFGGQRAGDRYGDRYGDRSGGFSRDRDNYGGGFNRGGFGQQRSGGYGDRYNDRGNFRDNNRGEFTSGGGEPPSEEPTDWRARPTVRPPLPSSSSYNNGSRQSSYMHSRPEPVHQQPPPPAHHQQYHNSYNQPRNQHLHNPPSNHSPFPNNQASSYDRPTPSVERPKLILSKRKTPLNLDDVSSTTRNEAIFGKAKPSSTPYQKILEVEEKLKAVQIIDRKDGKASSQTGSQAGSQPGSAPRSRRVSSNHSESNS